MILRVLVVCLFVAGVVSACIGEVATPGAPDSTEVAETPTTATPVDPTPTAEPTPSPLDTPAPTAAPTAVPSADPTEAATSEPGTASACSGTDDNRRFYLGLAESVDWDVYCAVLPAGWSVTAGEYQLRGGGWMTIVYRGPGGATLELRQGNDCVAPDDCVPDGEAAGDSAFGDREGTLVVGADGRYTVVVDRGAAPSWLIIGSDMDVADLQDYAAALARVD